LATVSEEKEDTVNFKEHWIFEWRPPMTDDYLKLLKSGEYNDVKLVFGDQSVVKCHKIFLARLPEFASLFVEEVQSNNKTVVYRINKSISKVALLMES
jgi:hypothetical protein